MRANINTICLMVAVLILMCPTVLWAQGDDELMSESFRVRIFTINAGGTSYLEQTSASFLGSGCVGDITDSVMTSTSFQMLPGYCAQEHWFMTEGVIVATEFPGLVIRTALGAPWPNPSSGALSLGFSIKDGEVGTIRIFDPRGRLVRTLIEEVSGPSSRSVSWDLNDSRGNPVAAGVYFARLETAATQLSRKVVLLGR